MYFSHFMLEILIALLLFVCWLKAEVDKVTLKINGDEALSNESVLKSNGDEALNDDFS